MWKRYFTVKAALLAALVCGQTHNIFAKVQDSRKPNVLLIIGDDEKRSNFGFITHGQTALTPHIDGLAKEGVYFSRAYTSSSVCTPSRYTCLTGRYASRCLDGTMKSTAASNGMSRIRWQTWLQEDEPQLATLLHDAGYFTGYVGKCDVFRKRDYRKVPQDSDPRNPEVKKVLVENQQRLVEDIKKYGYDYAASLSWANSNHNPCKELQGHNIEWEVKGALDFLDRAVGEKNDQPFFLCFATTLLHWPDPLLDLKNPDTTRTFMGYLDKPIHVQPSRESVLERCKAAGLPESAALATWLDDGIGALIQKLKETGLLDNTIIVYFNDNSTEGGKGSCYESGIHVPIMVYWKNHIQRHWVSDALIQNIDIVPTILEATGIGMPDDYVCDGKSLVPCLSGKTSEVHDSLYFEIGNTRAVITKDWKYLALRFPFDTTGIAREDLSHDCYFPGDVNSIERETMKRYGGTYWDPDQLYDLKNDVNEQANLWANPEAGPHREKLRNLLGQYLRNVPDAFDTE